MTAPIPINAKLSYELVRHDQLLKQVSEFMNKSGIRQFCQNKCHGACCRFTKTGECHPEQQDCINQPRLACNVWVCNSLYVILVHFAKKHDKPEVVQFLNYYMTQFGISVIIRLRQLLRDHAGVCRQAACFNEPLPDSVRQRFALAPTPNFENPEILDGIRSLMESITRTIDKDPYLLELIQGECVIGPITLNDIKDLDCT